jgi:hypothetical protein
VRLEIYEYIDLVGVNKPNLPSNIKPTMLGHLPEESLTSIMISIQPLQKYFHQYLLIGGFPEFALTQDIPFAQKVIREDVVDKVIKRDIVSLFNVRNPVIRNAVLMLGEEVLADPLEMGTIIETAVYKHIHTFFYDRHPHIGYFRDSKPNIIRIPAFAFLYLLGHAEKEGYEQSTGSL